MLKATPCRAGTRTGYPTPSHICFLLDRDLLGKEPAWVISSLRRITSGAWMRGVFIPRGGTGLARGMGMARSQAICLNPISATGLLSGLGHLLSLRLGVCMCETGVIVLAGGSFQVDLGSLPCVRTGFWGPSSRHPACPPSLSGLSTCPLLSLFLDSL